MGERTLLVKFLCARSPSPGTLRPRDLGDAQSAMPRSLITPKMAAPISHMTRPAGALSGVVRW